MCVIAYKPKGLPFPEERYLMNCFDNNPDGAGFMSIHDGKVYGCKGLMTYREFKKGLDWMRGITGDSVPYVMHFRIATQGFTKGCTHPFPLTDKLPKMKKLSWDSDVGIAHNGILQLTSDGNKNYSDTMLFIKEYLSLIVDSPKWYKNKHKKELIEKLITGSRLAILDKTGHCELMGKGWECAPDGTWYSNGTWEWSSARSLLSPVWEEDSFCQLAETGFEDSCIHCNHREVCGFGTPLEDFKFA